MKKIITMIMMGTIAITMVGCTNNTDSNNGESSIVETETYVDEVENGIEVQTETRETEETDTETVIFSETETEETEETDTEEMSFSETETEETEESKE